MANIFKENLDVTQNPNRNNHDLTHKVHGTYKMGLLYPFLCKPVVPTDSFRIDTACGFQFMPMPFPTQSNIRVVFHYFYCRNKNLWSNWENWLQGLEEHTPPFIDQPSSFYHTGSLADYLDIPTTLARSGAYEVRHTQSDYMKSTDPSPRILYVFRLNRSLPSQLTLVDLEQNYVDHSAKQFVVSNNYAAFFEEPLSNPFDNLRSILFNIIKQPATPQPILSNVRLSLLCSRHYSSINDAQSDDFFSDNNDFVIFNTHFSFETEQGIAFKGLSRESIAAIQNYQSMGFNVFPFLTFSCQQATYASQYPFTTPFLALTTTFSDSSVVDLPSASGYSPYYNSNSSNTDSIKISALPFRAYESIYRAYYANSVLQPLVIDGEKRFNRYNTNLDDGADTTSYHLFRRNWELDAYTSCLPSPQQGNAPLVGMNVLGQVTVQDPDTGAVTTAQTEIDGENVSLVVTSPIQSVEHGRTLVNLSNAGISIADLRQTNNLTRFLEQSIRSGYRYVDFIKGHFGNEPKYAELDMPEFLGGFSQRVDVNMVSNTNGDVPIDGDVKLGSYAGQARAFGGSEHGITRYFDDFGWIIGIMCIVPDGAYSQILPKHFNMNNRLDYYFPEFSEIGLQPVTYEEVAPIQSHADFVDGDETKHLTDTFGYQRPNHDLVWYPDTLHGQMRLSLKDTIINRVFSNRPELGDDFLTINPDETNNIFSVTEADNDVVIGQIVVKITAKRPVPRIVIPGLGR